jgi:2'-5' RNA ligase
MRRRMPLRLRPALPQRAIVAYPHPLPSAVEAFRAQHDPVAAHIAAHVTLVFPFASSLTDVQLVAHITRVVRRWPSLPIALSGVGAYAAQWVHLTVTQGSVALTELHDRLYRGALSTFLRGEFAYEPHVTIGRALAADACEPMVAAARAAFRQPLRAVLRELTLVAIPRSGVIESRAAVPLGGG